VERVTTSTFYGGSTDGHILKTSTNYVLAADMSGGTASGSLGSITVGQDRASTLRYCYEGFESWATDGLPDGDTVSSATLSLYLGSDGSTTDFTQNVRLRDWGATLESSDSVSYADLGALTLLCHLANSGLGAAGYYEFVDDALASNISTTAPLRVIMTSSRHEGLNDPTGDEWVSWSAAEVAGTDQDPKLVVVHGAGGGSSSLRLSMLKLRSTIGQLKVSAT
jgi:hypothetical protein